MDLDEALDKGMLKGSEETKNPSENIQNVNAFSELNNIVKVEDKVSDEEVKTAKQFPIQISSDLNQNKPPDIKNTAPESETKDNVIDMTAEELGKFLSDIVTNFRDRQGSE